MLQSLSDRASTTSPIPLTTSAEARLRGIPLAPRTWVRVRPGVYAQRSAFEALSSRQRYAVRVHALLRLRPDAVLCAESAAVLHGLPTFGEPSELHVHDPRQRHSRRSGDVRVHSSVDARQIEVVSGVRVTSLRDTVIDLARVLAPAQAVTVVDSAISPAQGGTLDLPALRTRSAELVARRGRARLAWTWDQADGRSESPAESVSRVVIGWLGFETPELQRRFAYERHDDRVDFFFPSVGAIGESDGWLKYRLADPEQAAALLAEEKRREDRLRRHGHPFARWEPRDAWRAAPLREVLLAAGVPLVRPPEHGMLASLERNPRTRPAQAR